MSDTVSIIIPTKDEEIWLPRALTSLGPSSAKREIIVADYDSCDGTAEIARTWGCRVVHGGLPAAARNAGARVALGGILVFVDADVRLDDAAFEAGIRRIRNGAIGVFYRYKPDTSKRSIHFAYAMVHFYVSALRWIGITRGTGPVIMARKSEFEACGGFPEEIDAAEDVEFIRRLSGYGRVEYEDQHKVIISARRFRAENSVLFMLKCVLWGFLRAVGIKRSLVKYRWHTYTSRDIDRESGW